MNREQSLDILNEYKEKYKTKKEVLYLLDSFKDINFNNEYLPLLFKRFSFEKSDIFKTSDEDFYGNIIVSINKPFEYSLLLLTIINFLVNLKYDRYEAIIVLKDIFMSYKNEDEIIDNIKLLIENVEEN